ncbi:hypothetical protein H6P81_017067 [Aristolochia fimbriata]|uniref:Glutathione S-transferase T1-like n=1 Tax=Aristolochia fimbriata TaxID=158543 RepID=A0AAV7E1C8_ARIFI|nr:hypothetical protein H6P81_017067 [Aristolochia fimbriata]
MELKVYAERLSEPSRAVILFCKVNGIEFEEVAINLLKGEHRTQEYKEINPMAQVPAIVHGSLKLFESHAILSYLACAFSKVPDHWYPADLPKRAQIQSVLDWHHSTLRSGGAGLVRNTVLANALGNSPNPIAAAEAEKILINSLSTLESFWLKGNGTFLLGNPSPSIADISLVCQIMQLELLDKKDYDRLLKPHKNVLEWIENVKNATKPHFDEVHTTLFEVKARLQKQQ